MSGKLWLLLIALFLAPASALGDAAPGDDDGWQDDDIQGGPDTCEDLCMTAGYCSTDCLPDYCLSFCKKSAAMQLLSCHSSSNTCTKFNTCLCNGIGSEAKSGDTVDDDSSGNNRGCSVFKGTADVMLPIAMLFIGLSALAYSLKSRS